MREEHRGEASGRGSLPLKESIQNILDADRQKTALAGFSKDQMVHRRENRSRSKGREGGVQASGNGQGQGET